MSGVEPVRGFIAYPSKAPNLREALLAAAEELSSALPVRLKPWEECAVGGKLIMQEICREIDKADLFCADVTQPNPNVMFELGYAVACDKRIWLIADPTIEGFKKEFDDLRLLTTVGYVPCQNAVEIKNAFYEETPNSDLENTVLRQSISPVLSPRTTARKLLYLKNRHNTEASVRLTQAIEESDVPITIDDPRESGVQSLSWYAQKIYESAGVVCHLCGPSREGARMHNARYALVSGLALGFRRQLLMLAESDYFAPVDYRDLLCNYASADQAVSIVKRWISPIAEDLRKEKESSNTAGAVELATELKDFQVQIGEYIAENEADHLNDYFVETTAYNDALTGRQMIFVGRKGTGKTANLLRLASALQRDPNNLVCVIKPAAYEVESLVKLFGSYIERDTKGYAIQSLWKYLLYSEVARTAAKKLEEHPLWSPTSGGEQELLQLARDSGETVMADFSIRLERSVGRLLNATSSDTTGVEQVRKGISEAIHENLIGKLRTIIGNALQNTDRVAILVDNLDKAWTKHADIGQLAGFLLGLLNIGRQLENDFRRASSRKRPVNVSLAIFLRSDIFSRISTEAREPDKLVFTRLLWDDNEVLTRVVEERFLASHGSVYKGSDLWDRYFCPTVRQSPTRSYILKSILPRPRDLVYFVKAAISTAVNRRHNKVLEEDILEAQKQYSQYAMDSILVEDGVTLPELEAVLIEFAGCAPILPDNEIEAIVKRAKIPDEKVGHVREHLVNLTFLGIETRPGKFKFADDPREYRLNFALSKKLCEGTGRRPLFKINPAFYNYLGISVD